jgi:hypothetical protein
MDVFQLKRLVVRQFGTLYDLSLSSNTPVEDFTTIDDSLLAIASDTGKHQKLFAETMGR